MSDDISVFDSDFEPNPKQRGVKSYPIATFVEVYKQFEKTSPTRSKAVEATAFKLNVSYTTVLRYLRKAQMYKATRKPSKRVVHPLSEFVKLRLEDRLTIKQISEKLDVSVKTVCKRLKEADCRVGKVRAPRREIYLALKADGLSNEQIAEKCGVSEETVRQMLVNISGGAAKNREMHPSAERYIELFAEGKSIREIAKIQGAAYTTVAKSLRLHGATRTTEARIVESNGIIIKSTGVVVPTLSIELPSY